MRNFKRVEVFTIDPKGSYYILHMEWWGTLKTVVLEKEWSKLLKANKLEEGYWIQCQESGKIPNSNWFSRWESGKKVTFGDGKRVATLIVVIVVVVKRRWQSCCPHIISESRTWCLCVKCHGTFWTWCLCVIGNFWTRWV